MATLAVLFLTTGLVGFHPTDDGNLLAQTYRILNGEVPHKDVIFARPMGSAVLHVIDYLVPLPLFEASRIVGLAEIVIYSYLFAWLTFSTPPNRWRVGQYLGATSAAFVNAHVFPSMGWYTTDGLLLLALGLVLVQRGVNRANPVTSVGGLIALGAAPLMKQSFFLAPLIGVIWIALKRRLVAGNWVREAFVGLGWAALPGVVYLALIGSLGGLPEFGRQVFGAVPVYGREFITAFTSSTPLARLIAWTLAAGVLTVVATIYRNRRERLAPSQSDGEARVLISGDLIARGGVTLIVFLVVFSSGFGYGGRWGLLLTWLLVAVLIVRSYMDSFDPVSLIMVTVAWATSLSWGYPVPNLVAGSVALIIIHRTWDDFKTPRMDSAWIRLAGVASIFLITAFIGLSVVEARRLNPYRDLPAPALTATLEEVSPEFGRIRTNPVTGEYMGQIAQCVDLYPASHVAVLPDNPAIYPALALHNPFPIDWMLSEETAGHEERITASAYALDAAGDYLVLYQTMPTLGLLEANELTTATAEDEPVSHDTVLTERILGALTGDRVVCGTFVGVYSGPAS